MSHSAALPHIHADPPDGDAELREQQFAELARLRAVGMENVETLSRWSKGDLTDQEAKALAGMGGFVMEYCRVSKAIRQVIVLELELSGRREAPDRDATNRKEDGELRLPETSAERERQGVWREGGDLYDRSDYDNGPLDRVIANVRKALRIDAPADDPFRPRKPRQAPADVAPVEVTPAEATAIEVTIDDVPPLNVANDGGNAPAQPVIRPRGDFDAPYRQPLNRAARRNAKRLARSRGPPK